MRTIVCFLLALFVSVSFGQITFTREWVKGKRSTAANSAPFPKDGHTTCRSLVSAVEYLIELEKIRRVECSECCQSGVPAPFSSLSGIQRTPSDFLPYLREVPSGGRALLDGEQISSNLDRRN